MRGLSLGAIKGKVQCLSRGTEEKEDHKPTDQKHTHIQPPETWELVPLSIVCNPYYELGASNTSNS
jgi:hypothetical protein